MASRFLFKSLIGIFAVFPVLLAKRNDIQDFILSSPSSLPPLTLSGFQQRVASPQDRFDLWLAVIDDQQEPLQRSQVNSSSHTGSTGSVALNGDLPSIASTSSDLADVWTTSRSRRTIRTEAQRLLNELERLNPTSIVAGEEEIPRLPSDFIFLDVWTKQKGLIEAERDLRAARLKTPGDIPQLRQQIENVRRLMREMNQDQVAAHVEFLQLEEAEMWGYTLRYLDPFKTEDLFAPLAKRGFQVLADRAFEDACQQLTHRVDMLTRYTATHAQTGTHAEWVRHETARCEQVRSFLEAMRDLDESQFDARVRLLAGLLATDELSETVRDLAVMGAHCIFEESLFSMLPLDEFVLAMDSFGPDAEPVSVHRSDVTLVWNDKRLERLIDSENDEFSLPQNSLRRVILEQVGTRPPILKGTPRSEAINAYNRLRGRVDWTVNSLQSLHEGCRNHSALLGEVWPRIERLTRLAAEFPQLFVKAKSG